MPFGFGRGFGRGWGRGWGNPYPYCRNFPWLPKWWWATPNANQYASTIPYYPNYASPANELDMLKGQTEILEDELEGIRKRIKEIESSKTDQT